MGTVNLVKANEKEKMKWNNLSSAELFLRFRYLMLDFSADVV